MRLLVILPSLLIVATTRFTAAGEWSECWPNASLPPNICYAGHLSPSNVSEATETCKANNGSLATIRNNETLSWMKTMMNKYNVSDYCWFNMSHEVSNLDTSATCSTFASDFGKRTTMNCSNARCNFVCELDRTASGHGNVPTNPLWLGGLLALSVLAVLLASFVISTCIKRNRNADRPFNATQPVVIVAYDNICEKVAFVPPPSLLQAPDDDEDGDECDVGGEGGPIVYADLEKLHRSPREVQETSYAMISSA